MRLAILPIAAALSVSSAASATETVTYTYDARGRLINVARAGSVNNGVTTSYQFDKADSRLTVTTTGGSGTGGSGSGTGGGGVTPVPVESAPSTTVVVPLNGYRIITVPNIGN